MITDPTAQPGLGWYTGSGLEVSDICLKRQDAQGRITKWGVFHSYTVATYWSETNQLCSVPLEDGRALPSPSDSIIRGHQGPCDLGVIEHSVCSFSADTSELPGGPYTYSWTVIGADSGSHPLNFSTLNIQTPASQIPFMLRVLVTDRNGCQVATEQSFTPRSSQEAAISTLLCEIRHLLLVNFRFNPLWDPLRDLSTTSITSADIIEDKRRQSPTGGDECASVCTTRVAGQREVRQAEP